MQNCFPPTTGQKIMENGVSFFIFPSCPPHFHISFSLSPLSSFPVVPPPPSVRLTFHHCLPSLSLLLHQVCSLLLPSFFLITFGYYCSLLLPYLCDASFLFSHLRTFPTVSNLGDSLMMHSSSSSMVENDEREREGLSSIVINYMYM